MIKLSSFLFIINFFGHVYASCSTMPYGQVIIEAKSQFENNNYKKGQRCLESYLKHKPNQEIKIMLVRSYLWSKDYKLANKKINEIDNKVERNLLKGDYFWYTGQKDQCFKVYDLLEKRLKYKNETTSYRKQVCQKKEVKKNSSPKKNRLAFIQNKFSNSDGLDSKESEVTYVYKKRESRLSFELRYKLIEREFVNSTLDDEVLALGIYKSWSFGEGYLIYETGFDTDYTYEDMYQVGYLQNIYEAKNKKLAIGGEYIKRKYSDVDVTLKNIKAIYYIYEYSFSVLIPDDFKSFMVKGNGNIKNHFLSSWYSAGSGESTRPYLSGGEESDFSVIGISYQWKRFSLIPYISYEYKREKRFNHKMLGIGVSYDF